MMVKKDRSRKPSPSALTDEPWAMVEPLLPPAKPRPRGGRPRPVERREGLHTLFDLNRSGCQGEMWPHDWLPKRTVDDDCAQWRDDGTWLRLVQAVRERTRVAAGREPTPRAACLDRPSVQTSEMGGPERGSDGGQNITGRPRHLWVDTVGVWLAVVMTRAGLDDGGAALTRLGHVQPQDVPRLVTILADHTYHHHALDAWLAEPRAEWRSAVKTRPEGATGFTPLEKRWVIARTHAWHGRSRSKSQDDERSLASRAAMIPIRDIHLLLNRLAPWGHPVLHDRQEAA